MTTLRLLAAGVLLVGAPALAPAASAQISGPDTVRVVLPQGERAEVPLSLSNEGPHALRLALAPEPAEPPPDDVGELLFREPSKDNVEPSRLTMIQGGNLLAGSRHRGKATVWEYTPELEAVRVLEHTPEREGVGFAGLTWMPPEDAPPGHEQGTIWWAEFTPGRWNPREDGCLFGAEQVALVETDLNDNRTGRSVEIPVGPGNVEEGGLYCAGEPGIPAYDQDRNVFYYFDAAQMHVGAIDIEGEVVPGYPVSYVYAGSDNDHIPGGISYYEGTMDWSVYVDAPNDWDKLYRALVADVDGMRTGVETPLMHLAPMQPPRYFTIYGGVRSFTDPSVMYFGVVEGDLGDEYGREEWLYAVRAAPLPPRWLRVAPVAPDLLTVWPGQPLAATVRFNATGLEVGIYEGAVAFRENDSGGEVLLRVPVVLEVTEGTDAEAAPEAAGPLRLGAPYPNPAREAVTVPLVLDAPAEVRLVVLDVLGREVTVLHAGPLASGDRAFRLDRSELPAGVYLLRATMTTEGGAVQTVTQKLTLAR